MAAFTHPCAALVNTKNGALRALLDHSSPAHAYILHVKHSSEIYDTCIEKICDTHSQLCGEIRRPIKNRKSKTDRKTCKESQSGCSYLNVLQYYKFVCFGEYVTYFLLIFATVRLLPIIVKKSKCVTKKFRMSFACNSVLFIIFILVPFYIFFTNFLFCF